MGVSTRHDVSLAAKSLNVKVDATAIIGLIGISLSQDSLDVSYDRIQMLGHPHYSGRTTNVEGVEILHLQRVNG